MNRTYIYIFTLALVIYLIRVLPLTLIKKQITNRFLKSFLYYVPYVTLSVMTFPAIISNTKSVYSGSLAFVLGLFAAWKGLKLLTVAVICCVAVLVSEFFLVG